VGSTRVEESEIQSNTGSSDDPRRSVTRDDVAALAGVSASTVSYVVNSGPRPVSEATRQRVHAAMDELGYRPNSVAASLRRRRTSTIGLLLPGLLNSYFADIAEEVERVASARGYSVVLRQSGFDTERERRSVNALIDDRIAGAVWVPLGESQALMAKMTHFGIPLVLLDRVPTPMLDSVRAGLIRLVSADNVLGGRLATEHLISLGHRRIALIWMPPALTHNQGRLAGYKQALAEAGIEFDPTLVVGGGYSYEAGRAAARVLLDRPDPPTAIFANYDVLAIGALRGIREAGLRVPEDVSVVGFDDIEQASFAHPTLTTIAQPKQQMGRLSAELLTRLIADDNPPDPQATLDLPVQLVVRESSGPCPKD
jgi:LacI family transcriptional regulator